MAIYGPSIVSTLINVVSTSETCKYTYAAAGALQNTKYSRVLGLAYVASFIAGTVEGVARTIFAVLSSPALAVAAIVVKLEKSTEEDSTLARRTINVLSSNAMGALVSHGIAAYGLIMAIPTLILGSGSVPAKKADSSNAEEAKKAQL